jgi:hypothetical protein
MGASVPGDDSAGLDDSECLAPIRPQIAQRNPEEAIDRDQLWTPAVDQEPARVVARAVTDTQSRSRGEWILVAIPLLLGAFANYPILRNYFFLDDFLNLPASTIWSMASTYDRYHYVGPLLLTILVCLALQQFAHALSNRAATELLVAWLALSMLSQARCGVAPDDHRQARQATEQVSGAIRAAIAQRPLGEDVYIDNQPFAQVPLSPTLFPGWAAVFTIFFPHNTVDGRAVYFVEADGATRDAARHGQRTRTLIVPSRPSAGAGGKETQRDREA